MSPLSTTINRNQYCNNTPTPSLMHSPATHKNTVISSKDPIVPPGLHHTPTNWDVLPTESALECQMEPTPSNSSPPTPSPTVATLPMAPLYALSVPRKLNHTAAGSSSEATDLNTLAMSALPPPRSQQPSVSSTAPSPLPVPSSLSQISKTSTLAPPSFVTNTCDCTSPPFPKKSSTSTTYLTSSLLMAGSTLRSNAECTVSNKRVLSPTNSSKPTLPNTATIQRHELPAYGNTTHVLSRSA